MIYEYAFTGYQVHVGGVTDCGATTKDKMYATYHNPNETITTSKYLLALTTTCKQLNSETKALLYAHVEFVVHLERMFEYMGSDAFDSASLPLIHELRLKITPGDYLCRRASFMPHFCITLCRMGVLSGLMQVVLEQHTEYNKLWDPVWVMKEEERIAQSCLQEKRPDNPVAFRVEATRWVHAQKLWRY